eukprot:g23636.t1
MKPRADAVVKAIKEAQEAKTNGYKQALLEIRGGRKSSHWIWDLELAQVMIDALVALHGGALEPTTVKYLTEEGDLAEFAKVGSAEDLRKLLEAPAEAHPVDTETRVPSTPPATSPARQTKEVQPRGAQGERTSGRHSKKEVAVKRPKQKLEEYYVQPRFAAGRLFAGGTTFASLAANTFYNPTLIDLVSTMVTKRSQGFTRASIRCVRSQVQVAFVLTPRTHIRMVKLPHSWEGKSYFELFDFLLWKEKLLAIGIYRTAEVTTGGDEDDEDRGGSKQGLVVGQARRKSLLGSSEMAVRASRLTDSKSSMKKTVKVSFVYTAPPGKETAMMPGDKVQQTLRSSLCRPSQRLLRHGGMRCLTCGTVLPHCG